MNFLERENLEKDNELEKLKKEIDSKSSRIQNLEKLIRTRGKDPDSLQDVIDALKVFDSDHDGKISVSEFTYAMTNMGE